MDTSVNFSFGEDFDTICRLSRCEIEEVQRERMVAQIHRAWNQIPFYRRLWEKGGANPADIRTVADISRLPVFNKDDLLRSFKEYPPFGDFGDFKAVRLQSTSGTSGMPKPVLHTRRDWKAIRDLQARRLYVQGVRETDVVQVAFQFGLFIAGFSFAEGAMQVGAMVIPTSSGAVTSSERQIELAQKWGTTVLLCTPSYALHLAAKAKSMGVNPKKDLTIRITSHTGEPLLPAQRERLEDTFGCKSFDNWGTVEIGSPTFECQVHGKHINEDAYIFEVVDTNTHSPLPTGREGNLIVTSLFKEAMPMIRYNTEDLTALVEAPCACGRTLKSITGIIGRSDDMFKVKGVMTFPSAFEMCIAKFSQLSSEYLIEVDSIEGQDSVTLRVECEPEFTGYREDLRSRLADTLRTALGFRTDVLLVDFGALGQQEGPELRVKATGKTRLIDKRKKETNSEVGCQ